jgi:hypothetical protein
MRVAKADCLGSEACCILAREAAGRRAGAPYPKSSSIVVPQHVVVLQVAGCGSRVEQACAIASDVEIR